MKMLSGSQVDIYSFGMFMYELISLYFPFEKQNLMSSQIEKLVVEGERPPLQNRVSLFHISFSSSSSSSSSSSLLLPPAETPLRLRLRHTEPEHRAEKMAHYRTGGSGFKFLTEFSLPNMLHCVVLSSFLLTSLSYSSPPLPPGTK